MFGHHRISVNSISSLHQSLDEDFALWDALGIDHVGLMDDKLAAAGWDQARARIAGAGLRVSNVAGARIPLRTETIELAASTGATTICLNTGSATSPEWDEAAAAFARAIEPFAAVARGLGVTLAIETTNPLRRETSFVHSLQDTVDVARDSGIGVVIDFYSTWSERHFADVVRKNIDMVTLVQVSDYTIGSHDMPNRSVIGDGDIPLERLFGILLDAGYGGSFDLEILGPRIESEGYSAAIRRSVERASEMLEGLGA